MNDIQRLLGQHLSTLDEARELQEELESIRESLYTKKTFKTTLAGVRESTASLLKKIMEQNNLSLDEKEHLLSLLSTIDESLSSFPIVQLTVAAEPSDEVMDEMMSWFREHVGHILVDLSVDESLIGGITIAFQGKYKDYSLRKNIDLFLEQKEKLNEN